MAIVVKDRVKVASTSTGTGTITLGAAPTGFQDFANIGDGNQTYYTIVDGVAGDWEVGIGTYTASGTTLSRDTVLSSSNSGNLVDFAVGTKDVFVTLPSERLVTGGGGGIGAFVANATTVTEDYSTGSGVNILSVGPITVASGISVTVASGQRWLVL
jgi:hypothetical protein